MIHVRSLDEISLGRSWLTIGVFDGVHRGHQDIVRRLTTGAHSEAAPAVVLTFWPHPATVLAGARVRCLTTVEERAELLVSLGVDAVVTHPFDVVVAETSAQDFVAGVHQRLHFNRMLIGYDFALGKGRAGDAPRLAEIGRRLDYEVEVVPAFGGESGVISSFEIRKLVTMGNVAAAAELLGHSYGLRGPVVHGDGRGRDLGFPTANIEHPPEKILPANGIYACWAEVGGRRLPAAVNVGVRPQFHSEATDPLVEAHFPDFDQDLYGKEVRLEFVERLRDELKFESVAALVDQIGRDVERTRELLFGV